MVDFSTSADTSLATYWSLALEEKSPYETRLADETSRHNPAVVQILACSDVNFMVFPSSLLL
jgi:hypothetical protein